MTDRLGSETIQAALVAARRFRDTGEMDLAPLVGRRIEFHRRIGSTSDRARELSASGEPEGTVVVAGEQTRGRGRSDRSWHSPPDLGLYMSVILRPEAAAEEAPIFGLLGAVAVASSLASSAPVAVRVKWPNDLVVDAPGGARRKIAGILAEARTTVDSLRDVVIGVGVNVNHQEIDFPPEIAGRAVSLMTLRGESCDRVALAAGILTALDTWYTLWRRRGDRPVLEAYRALCPDLEGRRVRVTNVPLRPGGPTAWIGTTAGLSERGALRVISGEGGAPIEIRYGEVSRVEET